MGKEYKNLNWAGRAYEDFTSFPKTTLREFGYDLYLLQIGQKPRDSRIMRTVGASVREIRVKDNNNQYRVIYVVKKADGIWVLHAFQKKTRTTPKEVIELAKTRFKQI